MCCYLRALRRDHKCLMMMNNGDRRNKCESQFLETDELSALSWKSMEKLWLTTPMSPVVPRWNSKHAAELMWSKNVRRKEKSLSISFSQVALFCSPSLTLLARFSLLKKTHVVSERPSMKFNSHPPNIVFIKTVTITVSRRDWPAQLNWAVRAHTVHTGVGVLGKEDEWQRTTLWERERERGRTQCVNKASKDWGSQQQGNRGA